MAGQQGQYDEIQGLKHQIMELKSFVTEYYSNQVELNSEYQANIELLKQKLALNSSRNRKLKYLVEKFKVQKAQIDLLVKLFQGKFMEHQCECGRTCNVLSMEKQAVKNDQQILANNKTNGNASEVQSESLTTQTSSHVAPMLNSMASSARCSYTPEQNSRIGQSTARHARFGPVESLDEFGHWKFQVADNVQEEWNQFYSTANIDLASRLLLLPSELSAMTMQFSVRRLQPNNVLVISLAAFSRRDDDSRINLPIEVTIDVDLQLQNNESLTERQIFVIKKMGLGYPAAETIKLSLMNCDKDEPPELTFKFQNSVILKTTVMEK